MTLTEWANRWGVPAQALAELAAVPAYVPDPPSKPVMSESGVQALVRLEAARKGVRLWRNNSGAGVVIDSKRLKSLCDPCRRLVQGRPIRWGLANDSANLNDVMKSHDLVGWRKVLITDGMVGTVIAQTVSRECKRPGWVFDPADEHEAAQHRWHRMLLADGGDSAFVTGEGSL